MTTWVTAQLRGLFVFRLLCRSKEVFLVLYETATGCVTSARTCNIVVCTCNIVVCVLLLLHDIPVAMFPLRCSYSIFLSNVLEGTFLQRLLNAAHRFAKQRTFTAPCPVT